MSVKSRDTAREPAASYSVMRIIPSAGPAASKRIRCDNAVFEDEEVDAGSVGEETKDGKGDDTTNTAGQEETGETAGADGKTESGGKPKKPKAASKKKKNFDSDDMSGSDFDISNMEPARDRPGGPSY